MKPITLKHWKQLRQLRALQDGLGGLLSHAASDWPEGQEERMSVAEWAPLVDISEDEKEYTIQAELPDVNREDVRVTAEGGTLTIVGERRSVHEEKTRKYHRVERCCGQFERSFSLPSDTSPGGVTADLKAGVLAVHLAKAQKPQPRPIEVKAG